MKGIARLAQELGISTGTVSRALNGKPDVSEETRRKVLEAARRHGYAPNQAARSLAQGTTRAVGFVIELECPMCRSASTISSWGYSTVCKACFARHGLDLFVLPCPTDQDRHAFLERFVARGVVDGIILAATRRVDPSIEFLQASGLPFVTFGRSTSGPRLLLGRPRFRRRRRRCRRPAGGRRPSADRADGARRRAQLRNRLPRMPIAGPWRGMACRMTRSSSSRPGSTRRPAMSWSTICSASTTGRRRSSSSTRLPPSASIGASPSAG